MNTIIALVCLLGTLRVSEIYTLDGRIFGLLRKLVSVSGNLFEGAFLRFLSGQTWPRFNLKKTQKQTPPLQLGVHFVTSLLLCRSRQLAGDEKASTERERRGTRFLRGGA